MTEWYWSGSLDAFADMCILRSASDAQEETRHVSAKISDTMQSLFPISWKALTGFSIKNKFFDEYGYYGENNAPLIDLEKKNTIEDREFYGDDHIRPMNDEEKKRAMERKELNQVWYDGDGGELFE
jgi:thymidylate synthase ThyX